MSPSQAKSLTRRLLPHPLYRRYRRRKVAALIADYAPRTVTHTYAGHELRVHLADPLAEGWYDHDWEELSTNVFLREQGVLGPGARVFDLGAHQGVIALLLAREVGASGSVVAIEAEPHNARVAERNRTLNDASNLTMLHAAAAARVGTISFAEGLNGQVDEHTATGNVSVAAVTVDELARRYGAPDLVLVDVEGYEAQVLRGASETLAQRACSFLVEIHETLADFGGSPQGIVELFDEFTCFVTSSDNEPPCPLRAELPVGRFFLIALAPARRTCRHPASAQPRS